METPLCRQRG